MLPWLTCAMNSVYVISWSLPVLALLEIILHSTRPTAMRVTHKITVLNVEFTDILPNPHSSGCYPAVIDSLNEILLFIKTLWRGKSLLNTAKLVLNFSLALQKPPVLQ